MKYNLLTTLVLLWSLSTISAQRVYVVDKAHPNAADSNPGTFQYPFTSINKAAILAGPGDTVLVHQGVYRERIAPVRGGDAGKPIVYMAAKGEKVIVKGSDVWQPEWQEVEGGVYFGAFPKGAFETSLSGDYGFGVKKMVFDPYQQTLLRAPSDMKLTLGQLFVEGQQLMEVDTLPRLRLVPGSWMVSKDGDGLLVHFPRSSPPDMFNLIELTTRSRVFAPYKRGLAYIHVLGFHFEHGATNFPSGFWHKTGSPQAGIVSCRGGNHWHIEGCTIRFGKSLGLDIGQEGANDYDSLGQGTPKGSGYHTIINNVVSDNGCGGIAGYVSHGSKIIGNHIERNNNLGFTAPEIGGIKLHFFTGGLLEGNIVRENFAYGIWLDNEWHNSRVTRNVMVGNEKAGIFMELGYGPVLIDNNFIGHTKGYSGYGLYSHDASGITFAHNMVYFNAGFGLWAHVATDRVKDLPFDDTGDRVQIEASNWKVVNNIFIGNQAGAVSLPLPTSVSENNVSDYNVVTGGYDRLSFETYAESLDQPYFLVNNSKGRTPLDDLHTAIKERLGNGLEEQEKELLLRMKKDIPFLTLEQWREVMGQDTHSVFARILRPFFATENLTLQMMIGEGIEKVGCQAVSGVKSDFYGNLLSSKPLPGPFQQIVVEEKLADRSNHLEFRGPYNSIKAGQAKQNVFILKPAISSGNTY